MNYNSRDTLLRLRMVSTATFMYTTIKEASQAASINSRSFSRSFPKALPVSSSFQKFIRASERFYELPDGSRRF
jgi:hypothetical protein